MRNIVRNTILAAAALFVAVAADAQPGRRFYVDAGWQFNAVTGNDFVSNASGWGGYLEGGYYILPRIAVGAFASFNTNNEYIPRQTYFYENGDALTTDMNHSVFQIPFGATLRYRLSWKKVQPYAEAKIGANYSEQYQYIPTMAARDSQWGFYASPEIGVTLHPFNRNNFGFQIAVYYSYATNRNETLSINGLNNLGFKLGVSF